MPQIRPGDRVRVSVEGVVHTTEEYGLTYVAADGQYPGHYAVFSTPETYGWRVEVLEPTAIPEPPVGSIVVHDGKPAWRTRDGSHGWRSMATGYDHEWADLVACPLVHVPDGHSLGRWRDAIHTGRDHQQRAEQVEPADHVGIFDGPPIGGAE